MVKHQKAFSLYFQMLVTTCIRPVALHLLQINTFHSSLYFKGSIGNGSSPFDANSQSAKSSSLWISAHAKASLVCFGGVICLLISHNHVY